MRKIIFKFHTGFCGMDGIDYQENPDDVTDKELDDEAWFAALQHAETYGIYPTPDREDDNEDDDENYSDNIEGSWEDYDPEKHDMLKPGGGKWFND